VLRTAIILLGLSSQLEFAVIGAVLLIGVTTDELIRRYSVRRSERKIA
jgi:ribose transport system permease protein